MNIRSIISRLARFPNPILSGLTIYFDLGTSKTRIAIKNKGIVLKEPTYLGFNTRTNAPIFFGQEAKLIEGKTPDFIKIVRPVREGILHDFDGEVAFLTYCLQKSVQPYLNTYPIIKPTLAALTCAPLTVTEIEERAVEEALLKSGSIRATIIEKPLATAAGCGFNIFSHQPHLIVDLGAGIIEIAIVSGGGVMSSRTLTQAGEHMSKLIASYLQIKSGVVLGEQTCESLKLKLLNFQGEEKVETVRGKSLETGLPKSIKIKSSEIREAVSGPLTHVVDAIKELLEASPPEITSEVYASGITLAGEMAGIPGLAPHIESLLKVKTIATEHYANATVYGLMRLDRNPADIEKLVGDR